LQKVQLVPVQVYVILVSTNNNNDYDNSNNNNNNNNNKNTSYEGKNSIFITEQANIFSTDTHVAYHSNSLL